jgi:hypothetical protein
VQLQECATHHQQALECGPRLLRRLLLQQVMATSSCQRLQHVCLQAAGGVPLMPSARLEIPVLVPEPLTPGMAASTDAASASCAAVAAFHSAWRRQDGRCRQEGCGWCVGTAGGQAEKWAVLHQSLKQLSCTLSRRVCVSGSATFLAGRVQPHPVPMDGRAVPRIAACAAALVWESIILACGFQHFLKGGAAARQFQQVGWPYMGVASSLART